MTDMKRIGEEMPSHRAGHCHYSPKLDGTICNAPAAWHFWVLGQDDPEAFCAFACEEHRAIAHEIMQPTDWHEVGDACIGKVTPARKWRFAGAGGEGFCYLEGEETEALEQVLELAGSVRASSTGSEQ